MAKVFHPQIISANDLLMGDVRYWNGKAGWTVFLHEAAIAHNKEEAEAMLAEADAQQNQAVGAYLFDVALAEDGTPCPMHFRERFRDLGPSNRSDLGRQAEVNLRASSVA